MTAAGARAKCRQSLFMLVFVPCAAVLTIPAPAAVSDTDWFSCPEAPARVHSTSASEAAIVCEVATRTVRFMLDHKFRITGLLRVQVVEELPKRSHAQDLGQFDTRTSEVKVLSYLTCAELVASKPPFGISMTPELHQSFIAHELAHAIAHMSFEIDRPSLEAHEYIAYTVQFAVMGRMLRERILDRYPVDAFAGESEISAVYLGLDPAAFAVKSYKHMMKLSDPSLFYRRLLTGAFVPTDVSR